MKRKIARLALIIAVGVAAVLAVKASLIADDTTSDAAIEVVPSDRLTVDSFCGLAGDWIEREYTESGILNTDDCFLNKKNKVINIVGNTGILRELGILDEYEGEREINNYELCEMLFEIGVQLQKYPENIEGHQISIENVERNLSAVNYVSQVVELGEEFNGNDVMSNEKAKEILDKFGQWLQETEAGAPEVADMSRTEPEKELKNESIEIKVDTSNGEITTAKYKKPASLAEIKENWENVPVFDNYDPDNSKVGFLNIWEGIANPEVMMTDDSEVYGSNVDDMMLATYPEGSTLYYNLRDDAVELRHPMYMSMGYCRDKIGKIPPTSVVCTIKDYRVTSKASLDWLTQCIYVETSNYLEADCLGFVVEKEAITGNEEDKGKLTMVVAKIPEFDKSHFR